MRFRLLRRRLTISAPRMSVRSTLPWPFRWAILAIVLGFCAAIGLWAFEFGKDIAGLDRDAKEELQHLRTEVTDLRAELSSAKEARDQAQSIANTAGTLVITEKASHERLLAQVKQLEDDNHALRDDLGFFEKLLPAAGGDGVAIRAFQAEMQGTSQVKWQVLVIQAGRNTTEFSGRLDVTFSGVSEGKPWSAALTGGPQAIKLRQYARVSGEFLIPPGVIVNAVTARVLDGTTARATQSVKL